MLKVKNVSYKYGKNEVLHNISFEIENSGIYGLIGSNGAGKSTLLELISSIKGLNFDGSIYADGIKLSLNNKKYKQKIGILFQDEVLEEKLTITETFDYFRSMIRNDIDIYTNNELIEIFQLNRYKDKLIRELSGGVQQRVKIALTCMTKPKILLLDEPTTGLDAKYRINFWEILNQLVIREKLLILLSTHDLNELEANCSEVIYLKHGFCKFKRTIKDIISNEKEKTLEEYYLAMEGDEFYD